MTTCLSLEPALKVQNESRVRTSAFAIPDKQRRVARSPLKSSKNPGPQRVSNRSTLFYLKRSPNEWWILEVVK